MTLMEYLEDYASAETRAVGEMLIKKELNNIPNEKVREIAIKNIDSIRKGSRDFRF
jgi:2-iminoacetate synthase